MIRRALLLFQMRLTIYARRQRLSQYRPHEALGHTMSIQRRAVVEKAVQDIQEMDRVCDRTLRQVESSLRILEDISRQFETDVRDCALRTAGLL